MRFCDGCWIESVSEAVIPATLGAGGGHVSESPRRLVGSDSLRSAPSGRCGACVVSLDEPPAPFSPARRRTRQGAGPKGAVRLRSTTTRAPEKAKRPTRRAASQARRERSERLGLANGEERPVSRTTAAGWGLSGIPRRQKYSRAKRRSRVTVETQALSSDHPDPTDAGPWGSGILSAWGALDPSSTLGGPMPVTFPLVVEL